MEQNQFNKLPKWAQSEITRLTRNLEHAKKEIDAINGKGETNTYITEGMDLRPLPDESEIQFNTEVGSFRVTVQYGKGIKVNFHGKAGYEMAIQPKASNDVFITAFNN